ncbi:MAG: peptidoglycan DD-metalloendopeptidase family protein [Alphaproteobacteria bacterium]
MKTLNRWPALRKCAAWRSVIPAALLAASLSGCVPGSPTGSSTGGPWLLSSSATRPDPPPIPLRKPQPPAGMLAEATSTLARAPFAAPEKLAETVFSAPQDGARITVQTLEPLHNPTTTPATTPATPPATAPTATPAATPARARLAAPARAPVQVSAGGGPVDAIAYRIQAGDTVYGVARRFAVPVRGVIDANSLQPPYGLRIGQVLQVPNPRRHQVQAGDTIYGVARRYGIDPSQLVSINRIVAPYAIAPGQSLVLPAASLASAFESTPRPVAAEITRPLATRSLATRSPAAVPAPPPRAGGKFLWPVQGHTIAGYGRKKDGLHNDGINIAAPRGASVRAADNGVVAYLGNELRGFGNLILVKHADGWVTAYAHNQDFLVERGQTVTRGQPIARIGSSGNVATPQLHFEIRKGTRSVDPTRFLGPQRAANAQPG